MEGIRIHPHNVIFSLYGQYVLPRGEEIWIGSLIQALAALDCSAGAVRALVSRMKRKGLLHSRRSGRHSFYRLSDRGLKEVRWGGKQAFVPSDSGWDGRWTVVTYSIPEKRRKCRDALRDSLNGLGFGTLAPGTWISPRQLTPEAEGKWRELDAWQFLEVFRAEHLAPSDPGTLVARAWPQLPALADHYRSYVAAYEPALRHFTDKVLDDKACFATRLRSLIDFVAITLADPVLPPALLPQDWARPPAQALFEELQHALARPAERFFDAVYEKGEETDVKKVR